MTINLRIRYNTDFEVLQQIRGRGEGKY